MAEQETKTIDERFDEVTQAFLGQRDLTMHCHDKLSARFDKVDGRLGRIELVLSEVLNKVKVLSSRIG